MAQDRTLTSPRGRIYFLPLVVALPLFFLLFAITEGWYLLGVVENQLLLKPGNPWESLKAGRAALWIFAWAAVFSGACWAWVILFPFRRYKAQLDRLAEEGTPEQIEVDSQSELSSLASSFNRVISEMQRDLPRRAQAVLDTVSSGVLIIDGNGTIEWINPFASRLFETPRDRITGRSYHEAFARDEALIGFVDRVIDTEADFPEERIEIKDRFGETRMLGTRAAWVRDSDQNPFALVLTLIDISRLEAFSSGVQRAEQLSSLGRIAAGIAHEVRNPLTSISGLAQLIQVDTSMAADKLASYADVILKEVDRVNRVVDRLSLLFHPANEALTPTPVSEIFESVMEMSTHLATQHGVKLELSIDDRDLEVPAHPQLLAQAILNLAINGIEAAPVGGEVRMGATRGNNGSIQLTIENDGPPIAPSEIDDIFQPFHTTKDHGAGLGLAITDSIVRDHHGKVEVRSGNDETVFTVTLPIGSPSVPSPVCADVQEVGQNDD